MEGKDKLTQTFRASLRIRDSQILGIVIDADDDLSASWDSLKNILIEIGYQGVPSNPSESGLVIAETELPKVGIWIMPDNKLPGMIEDFVRFLVPTDDVLWNRAETAINDIPIEHIRFRPSYRSKAIVHTWLAWQEQPGKPLGQAITAKYLDANADYARNFVAWLRRLFG
ncbi:MAG: hypothetical protein HC853_12380 [Anaerolineae bacterium]|nr:hypothetical protein [Anaerolineae bacterium]